MKKNIINRIINTALLFLLTFIFSSATVVAAPTSYWKFDEGSGTTAIDSSGNEYDGTITGATYSTTTPDAIEFDNPYSLEFDGIDDGVSTSLSLNNYPQFTLAGWAYPRSAESGEGWFGANDIFEFIFNDSSTLRCWTSMGAVNWSFAGDDDFMNNWHHITCIGDGNNIIMYVDGNQVASSSHAFTTNYGSGDNFAIGLGVQSPNSGPFDGFIDDVRVYAEALTPDEMSNLGTGSEEPDVEPIEYILTEDEQIPSEVTVENAVYEFTMSQTIIDALYNETGNFQFEQCVTGDNMVETILDVENSRVIFAGLEVGNEIDCSFNFVDDDEISSNTLTIGPTIIIDDEPEEEEEQPRRRSSGGGKKKVPAALMQTTTPTSTTQTTSTTEVTTGVRDLTLGDEGDDVKRLQEILISTNTGPMAQALAGIGATGYFGTYTRDALAEYQAPNGILPTVGYFGSITRAQMTTAGMSGLWW